MNWFWLGLEKEHPKPKDKTGWQWMDGTPYNASMDLWAPGEPTGWADYKCAVQKDNGMWNDYVCYGKRVFICKRGR